MHGLTARQKEILDFIENYAKERGHAPSFRDIMNHFGFRSTAAVYNHLEALKKKGAIQTLPRASRSISLQRSKQAEEVISLPLIGLVSAGSPIEHFGQKQMIQLPSSHIQQGKEHFLLRAFGDSLQEEFILEGDLLVLEKREQAEDGEVALVAVNGKDLFIRKVYDEGGTFRLESQQSHIKPLLLKEALVTIQGILISVFRVY